MMPESLLYTCIPQHSLSPWGDRGRDRDSNSSIFMLIDTEYTHTKLYTCPPSHSHLSISSCTYLCLFQCEKAQSISRKDTDQDTQTQSLFELSFQTLGRKENWRRRERKRRVVSNSINIFAAFRILFPAWICPWRDPCCSLLHTDIRFAHPAWWW